MLIDVSFLLAHALGLIFILLLGLQVMLREVLAISDQADNLTSDGMHTISCRPTTRMSSCDFARARPWDIQGNVVRFDLEVLLVCESMSRKTMGVQITHAYSHNEPFNVTARQCGGNGSSYQVYPDAPGGRVAHDSSVHEIQEESLFLGEESITKGLQRPNTCNIARQYAQPMAEGQKFIGRQTQPSSSCPDIQLSAPPPTTSRRSFVIRRILLGYLQPLC